MSPAQQDLYQRFYDVVLNNNTCKTNKYKEFNDLKTQCSMESFEM